MIVSHDRRFCNVSITSNKCWLSLALISTLGMVYRSGHSSFMHCDLGWGGVLRKGQYVHAQLSQCFVSCGSTNCAALWVTGHLGCRSPVHVVDELQRQAVGRRCCKRPSRLSYWSVCAPPTLTRRTACRLITVQRPKPLLPSSGPFWSSILSSHTPLTHSASVQSV